MSGLLDEFKRIDYEYVCDLSNGGAVQLVRRGGDAFVKKITDVSCAQIYGSIKAQPIDNVPRVHEIVAAGDKCVVIEEYINGMTVGDYLKRYGVMAEESAAGYILDVCGVLGELHKRGIIHRDITPSNVLLSADHAVVIDFGIAREEKQGLERDTELLGTQGYAAPEQFGFSQTDCRSDIYAAGRLFQTMLGKDYRKYKRVIAKAVSMDPKKRYRTAARFAAAVKRARSGRMLCFALIGAAAAFAAAGIAACLYNPPHMPVSSDKTALRSAAADMNGYVPAASAKPVKRQSDSDGTEVETDKGIFSVCGAYARTEGNTAVVTVELMNIDILSSDWTEDNIWTPCIKVCDKNGTALEQTDAEAWKSNLAVGASVRRSVVYETSAAPEDLRIYLASPVTGESAVITPET